MVKPKKTSYTGRWMYVTYTGKYRTADPSGKRGTTILKNFRVKVKMNQEFIPVASNLRSPFGSFYIEKMKRIYPDLISMQDVKLIEATELDGTPINNLKCMPHEDVLAYVRENEYPINTSLYDDQTLRNAVILYEGDPEGQQRLQANKLKTAGGSLKVSQDLDEQEDLIVPLDTEIPDQIMDKRTGKIVGTTPATPIPPKPKPTPAPAPLRDMKDKKKMSLGVEEIDLDRPTLVIAGKSKSSTTNPFDD